MGFLVFTDVNDFLMALSPPHVVSTKEYSVKEGRALEHLSRKLVVVSPV